MHLRMLTATPNQVVAILETLGIAQNPFKYQLKICPLRTLVDKHISGVAKEVFIEVLSPRFMQ